MEDAIGRDMRRREFLVRKDEVPCVIMTTRNRIEGKLHKRAAFRLIDELNQEERFIAATDSKIFDDDSNIVYESSFLAVRVDQIVWVKPAEDKPIDQLGGVHLPAE
ncbi:MAG: hypothetical protein PVI78_01960 [Anaerolineales bacterium]|jgi:hypothetical protein